MNPFFYVVGENIDGELIVYEFEGTLEDCKIEAEKTLEFVGGGHLDIFLNDEDHDNMFICDVEV